MEAYKRRRVSRRGRKCEIEQSECERECIPFNTRERLWRCSSLQRLAFLALSEQLEATVPTGKSLEARGLEEELRGRVALQLFSYFSHQHSNWQSSPIVLFLTVLLPPSPSILFIRLTSPRLPAPPIVCCRRVVEGALDAKWRRRGNDRA